MLGRSLTTRGIIVINSAFSANKNTNSSNKLFYSDVTDLNFEMFITTVCVRPVPFLSSPLLSLPPSPSPPPPPLARDHRTKKQLYSLILVICYTIQLKSSILLLAFSDSADQLDRMTEKQDETFQINEVFFLCVLLRMYWISIGYRAKNMMYFRWHHRVKAGAEEKQARSVYRCLACLNGVVLKSA